MIDIVVIGAGIAGLTCAQQLRQAGYQVVVLDKSRGVGGRFATRRLYDTRADHGLRSVTPQGLLSAQLIQVLSDRRLLQLWPRQVAYLGADGVLSATVAAEPSYTSPQGASAIAKCLAVGLEILLNWQVQAIVADTGSWQITGMTASGKALAVAAKAVVVTTPAPQAQAILAKQALPPEFSAALDAVEFHPCFSLMAGYKVTALNLPSWQTCEIRYGNLAWVGLDSSKRPQSEISVFVLQSTAEFAQKHLETSDLDSVAGMLLAEAAQLLAPWWATPQWFEIHRWRYAFPSRPLNQDCLSTTDPLPLVCAGDWCGDRLVESALQSGIAAAEAINLQLEKRSLLGADLFAHL